MVGGVTGRAGRSGSSEKGASRPVEDLALFTVAVCADADGKLPSEFRLFSHGDNSSTKGTYVLDDLACNSIMTKAAERGVLHMIDYDHASLAGMFSGMDPAEAGAAAGWFKPAVKEGHLYATNVEWTPRGADKVRAKEFRYISPACDYEEMSDGGKRLTDLINCALTNLPALHNAPPLMANRDPVPPQEKTMKILLSFLKLAETASEAEVIATLTREREEGGQKLAALTAQIGALTKDKSDLGTQVVELTAKLKETERATEEREVDGLIAKAISEGKITKADIPTFKTFSSKQLTDVFKAMGKKVPAPGATKPPEEEGDETAAEGKLEESVRIVCNRLPGLKGGRLDPAKVLSRMKERGGVIPNGAAG